MKDRLPTELKALVFQTAAALGKVVSEAESRALFLAVERVRRLMVAFRAGSQAARRRALSRARRAVLALPLRAQISLAHAYTLYLELVNACENAYRTHRLRLRRAAVHGPRARLIYVLTAHPTESRSPDNIRVLRRLQDELLRALEAGRPPEGLGPLLHLLWRLKTHPATRPRPEDEAGHLYSLLSDPILSELLRLQEQGHELKLRTWVGGDKDGHPGVGPEQMLASLSAARVRLGAFLDARLRQAEEDCRALALEEGARKLALCRKRLSQAGSVAAGDGGRIRSLRALLKAGDRLYRRGAGAGHPDIARALGLLDMFPGLVVPLELRDERGRFSLRSPIADMMGALRAVSRGASPRSYAQGCVVSMAAEAKDILEALAAVRRVFGGHRLPVIPLFETPEALSRAVEILEDCWREADFRRAVAERKGRFEVMLGYSDSGKRMGPLASRVAIHRAMHRLVRWARRRRVDLVFFHGAGGSAGRGGGTIEEQAATWPPESMALIKETVQGEMVERTLATPEILRSNVLHAAAVQAFPPARCRVHPFTVRLAAEARREFAELAGRPDFAELLARATPYRRLASLHIGSRPSSRRRPSAAAFDELRAIPWVLCWTQTRLLLPAWYGVGGAWRRLSREPGAESAARSAARRDPLLRSFLQSLAFTLAKCEPVIWGEYVRRLAPLAPKSLLARIEADRRGVRGLLRAASSGRGPRWDRPWLKESIFYRAPMIHPLNLLQIETLARKRLSPLQELLLRETVTGIAAGMLATG